MRGGSVQCKLGECVCSISEVSNCSVLERERESVQYEREWEYGDG